MSHLCTSISFTREDSTLRCKYVFLPAQFSTQGHTLTIERDIPFVGIEEMLVTINNHRRLAEGIPEQTHSRSSIWELEIECAPDTDALSHSEPRRKAPSRRHSYFLDRWHTPPTRRQPSEYHLTSSSERRDAPGHSRQEGDATAQ